MTYKEYMRSERWQVVRAEAIIRAGGHCQICGSVKKLNGHHNNYERLGRERPDDLVVLCDRCHTFYHAKADKRTRKLDRYKGVEVPATSLPHPPTRKEINAGIDKSGEVIRVRVDDSLIAAMTSAAGGITGRAFRLMGYHAPAGATWKYCPPSGWRHRFQGMIVEVDKGELFAEVIRCGKHIVLARVNADTPYHIVEAVNYAESQAAGHGREE